MARKRHKKPSTQANKSGKKNRKRQMTGAKRGGGTTIPDLKRSQSHFERQSMPANGLTRRHQRVLLIVDPLKANGQGGDDLPHRAQVGGRTRLSVIRLAGNATTNRKVGGGGGGGGGGGLLRSAVLPFKGELMGLENMTGEDSHDVSASKAKTRGEKALREK